MTVVGTEPGSEQQETRLTIARVSKRRLILRRFWRNKPAVVGVFILLVLILFAVIGPHVSKWSYSEVDFLSLKEPPSSKHWLGTDLAGGDMFAQLAHGTGRSLMIGAIASVGITAIAAIVGSAVAYFEGWREKVGTWILDMLLVIPTFLLLAFATQAASGTNGWIWLCVALMVFGWIGYARVLRALTLSLRDREYVTAAKFMGVSSFKILRKHVIPNLGSILIIHTVLGVVYAVEAETALSFLGFGITPPDTSLGVLIRAGANSMQTAEWMLLEPTIILLLLMFSMTLIGDGLRDALDPSSESGGKA